MLQTENSQTDKIQQKNGRLDYVRQFGTFPMAYSTLQPDLEEFKHPSFEGFIAFNKVWGRAVVLSNPVTHPKDYAKATSLFIKQYPFTVICQVTAEYADILKDMGFYVTGFGVDNILNMETFQVSYKVRPNLKRFATRLKNLNYVVIEDKGALDSLKDINTEWLTIKQNKKELRFLARPFISNNEFDVRIFLLKLQNNILGFCTFDPIYSREHNGDVTSYVLQHLRLRADTPKGAADYLLINALNVLQSEKFKRISIGLSLLHKRQIPQSGKNFLVEFLMDMFYNGNHLYKCKSVAEHKNRYHADEEQTFLAMSKKGDFISNFCVIKANGMWG